MKTCLKWMLVLFWVTRLWAETGVSREESGAYWFRTPAAMWAEALPLNETSIWAPPNTWPVNPNGAQAIAEVRRLLFANRQAEAEAYCNRQVLVGKNSVAPYQPLAFLRLVQAPAATPFTGYARGIELANGMGWIHYQQRGTKFTREAFVACEGEVAVFTFTADRPNAISFSVVAERPGGPKVKVEAEPDGRLYLSGTTGKQGVSFVLGLQVQAEGGHVSAIADGFRIQEATRVTLYVTAVTDYHFEVPSKPLKRDCRAACADILAVAVGRGAEVLRKEHVARFGERFRRTFVRLPAAHGKVLPALEDALRAARENKQFDTAFLMRYYDFCRYLFISASRAGGMPANLQGLWNPLMDPPWKSDWHLDINLSMFYWPAAAWDLSALAEPLIRLAEMGFAASEPVARVMLGVQEGAFLTTNLDAWGCSVPFRFPYWGMYVGGGAWLLQDALMAWRTTRDPVWQQRLLPLLRSQTQFFLHWLVRHPVTGKWVSGPSCSPENTYFGADGKASVDMGPAHDQELIFATLRDYLETARALTPEDSLIPQVEAVMKELALPQIGADGALMEWSQPYAEPDPAHRHLSHLWGLMPGRRLSLRRTPKAAEAVRKSLAKRVAAGHRLMGWSIGHRACLEARLGDGNAAVEVCDAAPRYFFGNLFTSASGVPQVADMNGVPAAVNEMLLQSYAGEIEVLPALPERFRAEGIFRLMAEGGFLVEAAWREGRVTSLMLTSRLGGEAHVHFNGREETHSMRPGEMRRIL